MPFLENDVKIIMHYLVIYIGLGQSFYLRYSGFNQILWSATILSYNSSYLSYFSLLYSDALMRFCLYSINLIELSVSVNCF